MSSSPANEIMLERNKSLARRIFDYFNRHDLDAIGREHSPNYVSHVAGGQPMDWPAHRQMIEVFYHAFPDFRLSIEDLIGENDKITIRFTAEGTHQGPFQGIPPTGKKVKMDGIVIMRFAADKRVEEWLIIDSMGLMLQLGAKPPSA
jgi:predicted ester cyclase